MADEQNTTDKTPATDQPLIIPEHLAVQDHLEERKTSRKFRYFLGTTLVLTLATCVIVLVAAVTYGYVVQGKTMEGTVIQSAFQSITQVFSILFGSTPSNPTP